LQKKNERIKKFAILKTKFNFGNSDAQTAQTWVGAVLAKFIFRVDVISNSIKSFLLNSSLSKRKCPIDFEFTMNLFLTRGSKKQYWKIQFI